MKELFILMKEISLSCGTREITFLKLESIIEVEVIALPPRLPVHHLLLLHHHQAAAQNLIKEVRIDQDTKKIKIAFTQARKEVISKRVEVEKEYLNRIDIRNSIIDLSKLKIIIN